MHKLVFTILVHGLPEPQAAMALQVLLQALSHPNPQVRELAIVALSDLNVSPTKRVEALSRAMQDTSARIRRRAARALGDFGAHALTALPTLTAALKDSDASVRRDAAGTLGRLGPAASIAAPGLVILLSDPDIRTRAVVVAALKRIGRPSLPALLEALHNPDPELRARSATVASRIAPQEEFVAAALRIAAMDEHEDVRRRVGEALGTMNTPFTLAAI